MSFQNEIIASLSLLYPILAGISLFSNILMIYITAFKSPKTIGAYKKLITVIAVFEIICSVVDVLLAPVHFSHGSAIIVISTANQNLFGRPFLSALHAIFFALFGASLAIFAVNFVYRYLVISQHRLLATFKSWKFIIWLSLPVVNGIIWSLIGEFLCGCDKETSEYMRREVLLEFGKDIDQLLYRGSFLYKMNENGDASLRGTAMFTLVTFSFTVMLSFAVIIHFGIKAHRQITNVLQLSTSSYHHKLQKQLFLALVFQTLIPFFFMHIPVGIMFSLAFLNIGLGSYSALVTISVTIYPAIDPIPNFVIIKPYRDAIFGIFCCRETKVQPGQYSSHI